MKGKSPKEIKAIKIFLLLLFFLLLSSGGFPQQMEEEQLYRKAHYHCLSAQWKEAIGCFRDLLNRYPDTKFTDAYFWIGYSQIELGNYQLGIKDLTGFALKYPSHSYTPQALYKVGEVYEKYLGDYDKALQFYYRITNGYSNNLLSIPASQNQGAIYEEKQDYPKAVESYSKTKEMAKSQGVSSSSPYTRRAKERIDFIQKYSDYDYEPLKLYSQGEDMDEKNSWNTATGLYTMVIEKYPESRIAQLANYRLVVCLVKQDRKDKARYYGEKFLQNYPDSPYRNMIKSILDDINKGGVERVYFLLFV